MRPPARAARSVLVPYIAAPSLVLGALGPKERDGPELARRAVGLVYLAPPAFVLVMGYAEATFMTFAVLSLLGLRSRRWWLATVAGFLAGVTRPVGVLLAVPAVVEGWQRRDPKAGGPPAAPVGGVVTYLAWAAPRPPRFWVPVRAHQDPTRRGRS